MASWRASRYSLGRIFFGPEEKVDLDLGVFYGGEVDFHILDGHAGLLGGEGFLDLAFNKGDVYRVSNGKLQLHPAFLRARVVDDWLLEYFFVGDDYGRPAKVRMVVERRCMSCMVPVKPLVSTMWPISKGFLNVIKAPDIKLAVRS